MGERPAGSWLQWLGAVLSSGGYSLLSRQSRSDDAETHWFDALLLRIAPVMLCVAAACIALGALLFVVVGLWTIKDAVW